MDCISFNQDCSNLVIGSKSGYQLYNLSQKDVGQVVRTHRNTVKKNLCLITRLFNSSLIAMVTEDQRSTLKLRHLKKDAEICERSYRGNILAVKLNRQRLVVCLTEFYIIHDIRDMNILHTITSPVRNPTGLCALSVLNHSALLAYPSSDDSGTLEIFDALTLELQIQIEAHSSKLAAVAFSHNADMIATASCKGTVIRLFSVSTGEKLMEFRRGLRRCVTISSLVFSKDGMFLVASSNTETVHVFKVTERDNENTSGSWANYLTSTITSSASALIPFSGSLNAWRNFATARLQEGGLCTTAGIVTLKNVPYILVVNSNAELQVFKLDVENGGECELISTQSLAFEEKETYKSVSSSSSSSVSSDTLVSREYTISDASYAYKLKRDRGEGPVTSHQELNEIIDNIPALEEVKRLEVNLDNIKLDDSNEFPPMNSLQ